MSLMLEAMVPSSLGRAEHQWAAPRFFSWRKKYLEDDSPSSAHFTRARTRAPAAAVLSMSAMLMSTDSRGSATDVIPASNFCFKWSARRAKRSRSRRLLEALEEQWREIMDLINLFPLSYHFPTDGKNGCLVLQYSQNDSMLDLSSRSCKTDTLHFHLPGPRGIGTGGLIRR